MLIHIVKLIRLFDLKGKIFIFAIIGLALACNILELMFLIVFVPLISNIFQGQEDATYDSEIGALLTGLFGADSLLSLCLVLMISKTIASILYQFFAAKFSFNTRFIVSRWLLESYLKADILRHLSTNSAELLRNITGEAGALGTGVLMPCFILINECLFATLLFSGLVVFYGTETILVFGFIICAVILFLGVFKLKLKHWGAQRQIYDEKVIQYAQESLNSIIDIRLNNLKDLFIGRFSKAAFTSSRYNSLNMFFNQLPRIYFEFLIFGMVIVALLAHQKGYAKIDVELFALFFVSAVRLMPSANRIVMNLQSLNYYSKSLEVVLSELDRSVLPKTELENPRAFDRLKIEEISLRNICFRYPNSKQKVLQNFDLTLKPGDSLSIVGPSGSGKSTLVSIILGLLRPQSGETYVNSKPLQSCVDAYWDNVAYVPQKVYLIDDTVLSIIVGDISKVNEELLHKILDLCQLNEVIEHLPKKILTQVGENGSLLSGGQAQRIGLARALYKNRTVLILDEATSAMDEILSEKILNNLIEFQKERILISITHSSKLAELCDRKITLAK